MRLIMAEIIDSDTRFYIDIDIKTKEVIGWNYGRRQELVQKLPGFSQRRIFITKGQYNKLKNDE